MFSMFQEDEAGASSYVIERPEKCRMLVWLKETDFSGLRPSRLRNETLRSTQMTRFAYESH